MTACSWDNPGAARYTGTVQAAIASYRLPTTTQRELVAQWEARRWADTIVIDRDSIRGLNADYAPEIRAMHFGSNGHTCATVSRAGWSPQHVETAVVLCSRGECVGVPAVCGNVFRLTRIQRAAAAEPAYLDGADLRSGGPLGNGLGYAYAIPLAPVIAVPGGYGGPSWGSAAGFGYAIDYQQHALCDCIPTPPRPVAAVPEPSTLALIAAGLGILAWKAGRVRG